MRIDLLMSADLATRINECSVDNRVLIEVVEAATTNASRHGIVRTVSITIAAIETESKNVLVGENHGVMPWRDGQTGDARHLLRQRHRDGSFPRLALN